MAGEVLHLPSLAAEVALPIPACPSTGTVPKAITQAGKGDNFYATFSNEVFFSGLSTGSHPVSLQRGMRVTTPTHALPPSFISGPGTFMVMSTRSRTFPLHITHESNHH